MEIVVHYYQHHIGDFIRATARLTDAQTMAYLRLIWRYYDKQKPLTNDISLLAFQIGSDEDTVRLILSCFFTLDDEGVWRNARCDKEIADYEESLKKKSKAGKASAERKKNASKTRGKRMTNTRSTDDEQMSDDSSTGVQLTNNQEPLTNNHKKNITPLPPKGGSVRFEEFWAEWPKSERKIAKVSCLQAWVRKGLDLQADKIIEHLKAIRNTRAWTTGYDPAPLTYLNQRRWEDGIEEIAGDEWSEWCK